MDVQVKHARGESCNFCSRGKLTPSGNNLTYPYDKVYEMTGAGLGAKICPDCLKDLNDYVLLEKLK